jgi:hypothetical protein
MPAIYESPDKGATVYEREFGESDRRIIKRDPSLHDEIVEAKMWGEIRRMAKTNPAMREYTDRCIELYHLLKDAK